MAGVGPPTKPPRGVKHTKETVLINVENDIIVLITQWFI